MTALLFPELVPTTFSIGFLESPFAKVKEEYLRWRSEMYAPVESKELEMPLVRALQELPPLSPVHVRWLFTPTASDWVAYFDNGIRGSDPAPVVGYLAQKLRCRGVVVHVIPDTRRRNGTERSGLYGIIQFQLFADHQNGFGNFARSISVAHDCGRWRFAASGAVQEFEEVAQYNNRRVVDRFTLAMLQRYCKALGIDVSNAEFYKSPSLLCWASGPWLAQHPHYNTIADAQQFLGIGNSKGSGGRLTRMA